MSKTIFITGATSGFGKECAKLFARNGHKVIATGRRIEKLEELKKELKDFDVYTVSFDVSDKNAVFKAVAELPSKYKNVDVLINSAGLALGLGLANDALLDDWDIMVDTNIKGVLYATKAILPTMVKRKTGYIFNLGSTAGNWPYEGGNVYGATKAFVKQFSRNLRTDLKGTNIRVSNIEPGAAKTEFSDVRFKGDKEQASKVYEGMQPLVAEDIANLIYTLSLLPEHVNVNSLEVMPTSQTWGGLQVTRD
ncbi:MAG: SDR family NAD(P)-dependent oxidoreductase [Sulfurospirillaceae bacterium]|nr:SDR family NAD(P)-dependent oxidoreductase [Sulfurospirillaceae bacterium]